MKRTVSIGFLFVAALAISQGGAITRKPKVGDVANYKLKMEVVIFGEVALYTAKVTQKVTEVDSKGNYSVEVSQSEYKVNLGGDEGVVRDEAKEKPVYTYSPVGALIDIKSDVQSNAAYRMAEMQAVRLPGKEVKVGDTWSVTIPADSKRGTVESKVDYKFEAEEKIGARDTILASFSYSELIGTDPASSLGKVWIDKVDGSVVKLETGLTNAPFPGGPAGTSGTYLLERID